MTIHESKAYCKEFKEITGIQLWDYKDVMIMAATGNFSVDILALDNEFDRKDANYKPEKCTYYDGKQIHRKVSMEKYIILKWGMRANQIIDLALSSKKRGMK